PLRIVVIVVSVVVTWILGTALLGQGNGLTKLPQLLGGYQAVPTL
ncbi:hypothetical protein chiPu_0029596, partial [Chiloscyllium punctatum]|nr:hypothetical protein [Chiloscyllium punctatum]